MNFNDAFQRFMSMVHPEPLTPEEYRHLRGAFLCGASWYRVSVEGIAENMDEPIRSIALQDLNEGMEAETGIRKTPGPLRMKGVS